MPDVIDLVKSARAHVEEGLAFHAELFYRQVMRATETPQTPADRVARGEACAFYATQALRRRMFGEAGDWFIKALSADPGAGEYRADFVKKVLLPQGRIETARLHALRATEVDPENPRVWLALGEVEYEAGNAVASRAARECAVSLAPEDPYLLLELARLELDTANYDRVRELCEKVLEIEPKRQGDVTHFLAMVAYREGKHEEAIDLYTKAIEQGCSDPDSAKWNRALPYHSIGKYKEGWADYEARGLVKTSFASIPFGRFNRPVWNGEPALASLHLHEEMGFGDTIALARYAPILAERGHDVRMEVRQELVGLFTRSFPNVNVVSKAVDYPGAYQIPPFDYHVPMLSLPHVMGTEVDTVPWEGPYLEADPTLVAEYDLRLPTGKRIGFCWSSGIRDGLWLKEYGLRKSLSQGDAWSLSLAIRKTGARLLSLQIGGGWEAAALSVLPEHATWDDTAAVVSCLDLVITVDTALAHLAGALGKPVWVLVADQATSWHWMTGRSDSPWYPTAKLYRQGKGKHHEWDDVISRIIKDLNDV